MLVSGCLDLVCAMLGISNGTTGGSSIRYHRSTTAGEPGTTSLCGDLYFALSPRNRCAWSAADEWFHFEVSGCCSGVLVLPFWSGGDSLGGCFSKRSGRFHLALSHGASCGSVLSCFVCLVSCRMSVSSCLSDPIYRPLHWWRIRVWESIAVLDHVGLVSSVFPWFWLSLSFSVLSFAVHGGGVIVLVFVDLVVFCVV